MLKVDINCDLGEGLGNEQLLMPLISSCNVACGSHAGDPKTIETCLSLAGINNVKIGAHPSYPDRHNFGRKKMDISPESLKRSVVEQINLVKTACLRQKLVLHHVKLHGALYNFAAQDEPTASLIFQIIHEIDPDLYLYLPYASKMHAMAKELGVKHKAEAFADRNYKANYQLISRNEANAILTDPDLIIDHLMEMIAHNQLSCLDGKKLKMHADTYCFHGDQIGVEEALKKVVKTLNKNNISVS